MTKSIETDPKARLTVGKVIEVSRYGFPSTPHQRGNGLKTWNNKSQETFLQRNLP
jgi:hypothetical protein